MFNAITITRCAHTQSHTVPVNGTARPVERLGALQTQMSLICAAVVRPKRCPISSNPALLPSWTVVCLSFTLLMLLLPGWPTMSLNHIQKKKKITHHLNDQFPGESGSTDRPFDFHSPFTLVQCVLSGHIKTFHIVSYTNSPCLSQVCTSIIAQFGQTWHQLTYLSSGEKTGRRPLWSIMYSLQTILSDNQDTTYLVDHGPC